MKREGGRYTDITLQITKPVIHRVQYNTLLAFKTNKSMLLHTSSYLKSQAAMIII